jgi:hypothetical protein
VTSCWKRPTRRLRYERLCPQRAQPGSARYPPGRRVRPDQLRRAGRDVRTGGQGARAHGHGPADRRGARAARLAAPGGRRGRCRGAQPRSLVTLLVRGP